MSQQISGDLCLTLAFLSPRSWTLRRARICKFSLLDSLLCRRQYGNRTSHSISGQMTGALVVYSATFMRYSLAVSPKNYLLFLCHFVNTSSQLTQGYRYMQWHHWGGKEKMGLEGGVEAAKEKVQAVESKVKDAVSK